MYFQLSNDNKDNHFSLEMVVYMFICSRVMYMYDLLQIIFVMIVRWMEDALNLPWR